MALVAMLLFSQAFYQLSVVSVQDHNPYRAPTTSPESSTQRNHLWPPGILALVGIMLLAFSFASEATTYVPPRPRFSIVLSAAAFIGGIGLLVAAFLTREKPE